MDNCVLFLLMEGDMQTTSTGVSQVCVIYSSATGKIVHIHSEIFVKGMKLYSKDKMEKLAKYHARKAKRDLTGVKTLHLRDPQFVSSPSRVDPKKQKLEFTRLPSKSLS